MKSFISQKQTVMVHIGTKVQTHSILTLSIFFHKDVPLTIHNSETSLDERELAVGEPLGH